MRLIRSGRAAVAGAVGVAVLSSAAVAQGGGQGTSRPTARPTQQTPGARPIRFATPVTDSLRASDPKFSDRGAFRVYQFAARADKRYLITLDAPDFDAYVWVARQVGVLTEEIASDDDGGTGENGTNARLRFKPPANGNYFLVAQSLSADGVGGYTLRVEEQNPPPPPTARPISIGQALEGELTDDSPLREDEGSQPHDVYVIRGKGQRVRILMSAEGFDAYLQIVKTAADGSEEQVASDDDGGGGTNARITFTLDGEYRIIARSLGEDGRGRYQISVTESPMVPVEQRSIALGETRVGELTAEDPELDGGGHFHEYVVNANAGDSFRITMRSSDFDSFLRWGTKNGDNFTEISTDDDSGGDLDSQLTVRAAQSGRFVIRVSSLSAGSTGSYRLTFERAP